MILLGLVLASACDRGSEPGVAEEYRLEVVVPGSPFHGVHGLTSSDDGLWVASIIGQTIHLVDPDTGAEETAIGPPWGCAEDLVFGPDGRLYWTHLLTGQVLAAVPGQPPEVLAEGHVGLNAIGFDAAGRLFVTEVLGRDGLYEVDLEGGTGSRPILRDIGGLNAFAFADDGRLYGPLWFRGEVVRVDVDSKAVEVVASGFRWPVAAAIDSRGRLFVADSGTGEVVRVDPESGTKTVVARVEPSIDNMTITDDDRLFVTNMASNGVYEIDVETGASRTVVEGALAMPAALELVVESGRELLHVADVFSWRTVDPATGEVRTRAQVYGDDTINPATIAVGAERVLVAFFVDGATQVLDRATAAVLERHTLAGPGAALALGGNRFLVGELDSGHLVELAPGKEPRPVATGLDRVAGLAAGPPGRVWVTEAGAGRLTEVDLASGERRVVASGLDQPEGIAVTASGQVLVAEVGARSLSLFEPATGRRRVLATDLPIGLPLPEGWGPPFFSTGLALSTTGVIYLSSDLDSAIYRLVPQG